MQVAWYETGSGRRPAEDFIDSLPLDVRSAIRNDIHVVAEYGRRAPASVKAIAAHSPLCEIRTLGLRTFFYVEKDMLVVLHVCKKQDQAAGIRLASKRMRELRGG